MEHGERQDAGKAEGEHVETRTVYRSPEALNEAERADIWEILKMCDGDFYPPLSQRQSSYQKTFAANTGEVSDEGPRAYFDEMIRQEFLLTYVGDEMVGFMTFRTGYEYEKMGPEYNPSLYMTTACVKHSWRERGIMGALYDMMDEMTKRFGCPAVTTRTWSTNDAQMAMLPRHGFRELCVLKDDRGPGVDTVYFGKIVI